MMKRSLLAVALLTTILLPGCSRGIGRGPSDEVTYPTKVSPAEVVFALFQLSRKIELPIKFVDSAEGVVEIHTRAEEHSDRWSTVRVFEKIRIINEGKGSGVYLSTVRESKGRWDDEDQWTPKTQAPAQDDNVHKQIREMLIRLDASPPTTREATE
ncbi:MAG TPA: hypothetical protein VG269_17540 [Tepidisphaeraceae bacterium]|jgi:hypothetical protein|nr:hypothetical protein [Tepidisphaeraceae bacterium]